MRKYVDLISGFSFVGKVVIMCLYPIGTIAMLVYLVADNIINRKSMEHAVSQNPTEENVLEYVEYLERKHFIINTNHPSYWNAQRQLWNKVNHSKNVSSATKARFLKGLKKGGTHIFNESIINNFQPGDSHTGEDFNSELAREAMEESRKAVTPFDHGGYVQGDGFNPSDTMAADAARQAQQDAMGTMNPPTDMNNPTGMF